MNTPRNRSERASTRKGQAVVVNPLKRQQPRSAGHAWRAETGMYTEVHEDFEHQTGPDHARTVDL